MPTLTVSNKNNPKLSELLEGCDIKISRDCNGWFVVSIRGGELHESCTGYDPRGALIEAAYLVLGHRMFDFDYDFEETVQLK